MSAYFARLAQRTLETGAGLQPVTNRYLAALQGTESGAVPNADAFSDPLRSPRDARDDDRRGRKNAESRDQHDHAVAAPPDERLLSAWLSERGSVQSLRGIRDGPFSPTAAAAPNAQPPTGRPLDGSESSEGRRGDSAARVVGPDENAAAAVPNDGELREARLLPAQRIPDVAAHRRSADPRDERRSNEPPTVHVHIGRIDVRAIETPASKAVPLPTGMRKPSLAAHLRARDRSIGG